jgi:hypothetical protein
MEKQKHENIIEAVKRLDIKDSTSLSTEEVGSTSLLTNEPLTPNISQTGTTYATQNNVQITDISRVQDRYDLLEIDWDFKNTTSKPFVQDKGLWTRDRGSGSNLMTYGFPNDYFTSNHVLKNIGETFLSMRADLHFVVSIQSSPLLRGALIIHPGYLQGDSPSFVHATNTAYLREHAILDASDNSSTVDLIVPFRYYRNGTDPFSTIFNVYIDVLVPLAGLDSVAFTVTAFLENQEFKFLRPMEAITSRRTQGLVNVTTINNTLSEIENATLPLNMTGDTLNVSGMDDVSISTNPTAYMVKFNSLNNARNPHNIEKVAINPNAINVATSDTFNTRMDEMSIKHIMCERDHYVDTVYIDKTIEAGKAIYSLPLAPTVQMMKGILPYNAMCYISDAFKFWRGGLKFKIKFIMNRFQSMKFYLGLFYKSAPPVNFTDWSSSHGVVFDIGGDTREITVVIPYNSETPWLHVPNATIDTEKIHKDERAQWFDYIMGSLTLYALTPLITTDSTNIAAIITMCGEDDFELANYTVSTRASQADEVVLSKRSTRTPNYITDTITTMKDLYSKYVNVGTSSTIVDFKDINKFWVVPPAAFLSDTFNPLIGGITSDGTAEFTNAVSIREKIPKSSIYAGYHGGLTARIEMDLSIYSEDGNDNSRFLDYYRPMCMYFNPDSFGYTGDPAIMTEFYDQVLQYLGNAGSIDVLPTPYTILPVNNTQVDNTGKCVYEIDIPYQRNTKYIVTQLESDPFSYGLIIFGYYKLPQYKLPEYVTTSGNFDVYAKISDEGRFGIINTGDFAINEKRFDLKK